MREIAVKKESSAQSIAKKRRGDDMSYKIRKSTNHELEQLKEFLSEQTDEETAENLVENYYFVVLEGYQSDCPGYCGKLLFGVYGFPGSYQLYGWINGKLVDIEQEGGGE